MPLLARIPLAFEPGTHWKYGINHDILGALIEVAVRKDVWTISEGVYS